MAKNCEICNDNKIQDELFRCLKCDVIVHKICYGISEVTEIKNYLCEYCRVTNDTMEKRCEFCPSTSGALKLTTNNKWVHAICAVYVPSVSYVKNDSTETADISKILLTRSNCSICRKKSGVTIKCDYFQCSKNIHVTCGASKNTLHVTCGVDNKQKYGGYCVRHQVNKTSSVITF